jgi:hypothetical protein
MSPANLDDKTVRRYLLGHADDVEQQRVEEALLLDETGRRQIAIVEDELIEEYLAGELKAAELSAFQDHFLAPKSRRENLRLAESLRAYIDRHPGAATAPPRRAWSSMSRFALAAAVLAIVAAAWLALNNRATPPIETAQKARTEQAASAPAQPFVLTLSPGLLRSGGGGQTVLDTRPASSSVELHLVLPQGTLGSASYSAALSTVEGREAWRQADLKPQNGAIIVLIPTSSLSRGDWRLALTGTTGGKTENISSYYFRVLFD